MKGYGLHFGIAYQLLDDYFDQDIQLAFAIDQVDQSVFHAKKAQETIKDFPRSVYKDSLLEFSQYLIDTCRKSQVQPDLSSAQ